MSPGDSGTSGPLALTFQDTHAHCISGLLHAPAGLTAFDSFPSVPISFLSMPDISPSPPFCSANHVLQVPWLMFLPSPQRQPMEALERPQDKRREKPGYFFLSLPVSLSPSPSRLLLWAPEMAAFPLCFSCSPSNCLLFVPQSEVTAASCSS